MSSPGEKQLGLGAQGCQEELESMLADLQEITIIVKEAAYFILK